MRLSAVIAVAAGLCLAASAFAAEPEQPLSALPYTPSLDLSAIDRSATPCEDFYRYACGGWIAKHPIPDDEARWSVYEKLQDENLRFLWGLLRAAAEPRPDRSAHERLAGDYFAACMADAGSGDASALAAPLAAIDGLASTRAIAPLVAELHRLGAAQTLLRIASEQDAGNATQVIAVVDAAGLGLPDRDHYLTTDARSRRLRADYEAHVARTLALAGDAPDAARAKAARVLAGETALAGAALTREPRRDPRSIYHRGRLADLQRAAPRFDWTAYFAASGIAPASPVNLAEPRFLRAVNTLLASRPLADWQAYLRWHLLNAQSPYLGRAHADAHFDFYEHTLQGVPAQPPRWKRCVRWTDRDLGEALGRLFVEKTFAPETKAAVEQMTRRIEAAMAERIDALPWMSAATKKEARRKLGTMVEKIGYPERWRDYAALAIVRDDFLGNVQRSLGFERARQLAKIGKPVDRGEWGMTPPTVNAYYDPFMNDINFPAGILQPPLFDPRMDAAPNYGNTGATIGHELTHGFDDEGRQFDADGNLKDWWTPRDAAAFKQRAQCIVDQYGQHTVVDDIKLNSRLTLGEDVADLGGTILAYEAWRAATANQRLAPVDGYTPDQRFFIGMAQWACGSQRPERRRLDALINVHSPPELRVNGVLANMPEFAAAFACKPGQPMARRKVCRVW